MNIQNTINSDDIERMPVNQLDVIKRLSKDLRDATKTLDIDEVRFLVRAYYRIQGERTGMSRAATALEQRNEPNSVISYLGNQSKIIEDQIKTSLDIWTTNSVLGSWTRSNKGIGPVIASALMANIDIERAPTCGHIYSFAGLVPGQIWKKGEKRPWSGDMKLLCWKIGESFVKTSGGENPGYYGLIYKARREQEIVKNEAGEFADFAKKCLDSRNYTRETGAKKAYEEGKLPPAHILARAKRFAVKRFLSDYHVVAYYLHYGRLPPRPYVIEHLGHAHIDTPDTFRSVDGLAVALKEQWGVTI